MTNLLEFLNSGTKLVAHGLGERVEPVRVVEGEDGHPLVGVDEVAFDQI